MRRLFGPMPAAIMLTNRGIRCSQEERAALLSKLRRLEVRLSDQLATTRDEAAQVCAAGHTALSHVLQPLDCAVLLLFLGRNSKTAAFEITLITWREETPLTHATAQAVLASAASLRKESDAALAARAKETEARLTAKMEGA